MAFSLSTVPLTYSIEPLALIHEPYLRSRFHFFLCVCELPQPFEVWVQGAVLHSCCNCHTLPSLHSNTEANSTAQTNVAEQQPSVSELKHYCRCKDKNRAKIWTERNSLLTWVWNCASVHVMQKQTLLCESPMKDSVVHHKSIQLKILILSRTSLITAVGLRGYSDLEQIIPVLKDWNICDKSGWRQRL